MSECFTPVSLVLLALTVLAPASGLAMTCATRDGGQVESRLSPESVAIPAGVADGTVVWRSRRIDVPLACHRDGPGGEEEIVLHLNPDRVAAGTGVEIGLTLDGADHRRQSGILHTGVRAPACERNAECPSAFFNLAFSVFVEKRGETPYSGKASDQPDYRLFQVGGASGPSLPGASFSYLFGNLAALRFIACEASLRVVPETVSFGEVAIAQVSVGSVIDSRPFALETRRDCESPFSLDARFRPVTGNLVGDVLVPVRNPGVGIRLRPADSEQALRYNEPFALSELHRTTDARREFLAELLWQAANPRPGPFEAEVMIDLFYK